MVSDRTQHQTSEELQKARELSLESSRPPAQIPGYRLLQYIGSGAYGEVWSATQLKTGRRVAIKFYTRRSNTDVELLAQEVTKLLALTADARYVVQLLDVGFDSNPPYYVMDYIEQGSLEDRLKNGQTIPTSEAVDLFQEVATGMMHLHGKQILHCDLKPGNILLDQDGKPRVADFGQSRLSTDETPALGTLFYMAPEQADMTAIPDVSWDVYGLGALLFSMLTGVPPYYSTDLAEKIEKTSVVGERLEKYRTALLSAPLPTEHREVPGVDRMLAELIDRCIAADPKKRFGNVQSVLLALRQRELTRSRRPLMLLGLIGPLLLMGVVAAFGWWASDQAISQTNEAVKVKAKESNEYAAQLAARSAAEQIDEYFRVVGQLARDDEFRKTFEQVVADDELKKLRIAIADPNQNSNDETGANDGLRNVRTEFIANKLRQKLQPILQKRLDDPDHEFPTAASWFVCDRYGNQIASVFRKKNITLANNFSYRNYFTGFDQDLPLVDKELSKVQREDDLLAQRPILDAPHLSAVFNSKQSKTWKVAFSAPIRSRADGVVVGIVAVTVDLGNLIEFGNTEHQYAMLVDGRRGENFGVILEHPLFDETKRDNQGRLPNELATLTVDLDAAEQKPVFNDPSGQTQLGKHAGYGSDSIVSKAPVNMERANRILPTSSEPSDAVMDQQKTGLWVLAVQDYENVLSDVRDLGKTLGRLAAIAGIILLGVAIGMWLLVNRMMRESRERLARTFLPSTSVSSFLDLETLPLRRPQTSADALPTDRQTE